MLTEIVLQFMHRLRDGGVPVSMVEGLDAMRALAEIDVHDRRQVHAALATTLIKRAEHLGAFEATFNALFARGIHKARDEDASAQTNTDLLERLLDALRRDDSVAMQDAARLVVDEHGGIANFSRNASPNYYLYRILRQLDLSNLLMRALREAREESMPSALDARLVQEDYRRRIEDLRKSIADALRQRMQEFRQLPRIRRAVSIEDVDFIGATPSELREMRQVIRPLARKLTARATRRGRARRRGHLDVRRTVRNSLSSGGVPLKPTFKRPRFPRPELYLLCDLSGSVAEFAEFTIALLTAMSEEFPRLRCFAFVDGIDEVTQTLRALGVTPEAMHLLASANLVHADGHSDYGRVFRQFLDQHSSRLAGKATVIITGDARNNYRDPSASALRAVRQRARRMYWLNPEHRNKWNSTDSIMDVYAQACDGVFEVRNLGQLAAFVENLGVCQ